MRTLRVPCATPQLAVEAKKALTADGVNDVGVQDRHLFIPAGWSPLFVWDLAEQLQAGGFADDEEIAVWASAAASARPDSDPGAIRNQPAAARS